MPHSNIISVSMIIIILYSRRIFPLVFMRGFLEVDWSRWTRKRMAVARSMTLADEESSTRGPRRSDSHYVQLDEAGKDSKDPAILAQSMPTNFGLYATRKPLLTQESPIAALALLPNSTCPHMAPSDIHARLLWPLGTPHRPSTAP